MDHTLSLTNTLVGESPCSPKDKHRIIMIEKTTSLTDIDHTVLPETISLDINPSKHLKEQKAFTAVQ